MSSRLSFVLIFTFLLGFPYLAISQDIKGLKLISYRQEGRVLLRWAPKSSASWLEWNDNGYSLIRYTIIRDSIRVYPPESLILGNSIRPTTVDDWEKASMDNKYAAIAAQAIYGNSFQAETENDEKSVMQFIQLAKEQEMRYSFTILSADQSFEVAELAGLGYEDIGVKEDEIYLYKLFGNNGLEASDTVYNYVDLYDHAQLPKVIEVSADFKDRVVSLSWRSEYYVDTYTSYLVEKSTDGSTFKQLDDLGTITASQDRTEVVEWMMKSDSLADNNKLYYYRIRGRTAFGIVGPPSDVVEGSGRKDFSLSIGIINAKETQRGVDIGWSVEGQAVDQIDKFLIERSTNSIDFKLLDSVSGNVNHYKDLAPQPSNYYKVTAKNVFGDEISSLPYFVQTHDSIPPSIPTGLLGMADTTGLVTLNWLENIEPDVVGYRVFRSRSLNGVFRQVTVKETEDTLYQDVVELNTLSKNIYYKVSAVDNRGNTSELSSEVLIDLPDLIPPVPPRITGYKINDSSIVLSWINSSSKDVVSTKLFKRTTDSLIHLNAIDCPEVVTEYIDSTGHQGAASYYLIAFDESGNESAKSNSIEIDSQNHQKHGQIKLVAKADRRKKAINLSWEPVSKAQEFRIYKSKNEEPISLYKVLTGNITEFEDDRLEVNSVYHYRVQLVNLDQGNMVFSKQVDIVY